MDLSVLNSIHLLSLPLFSLGLLSYRSPCFLVVAQSVEKTLGALRLSDALWLSPSGFFIIKTSQIIDWVMSQRTRTYIYTQPSTVGLIPLKQSCFLWAHFNNKVCLNERCFLIARLQEDESYYESFRQKLTFHSIFTPRKHKITTLRLICSDISPCL